MVRRREGCEAVTNPAFAVEAGLAALRWLIRGYGYEVAPLDVRAAAVFKASGSGWSQTTLPNSTACRVWRSRIGRRVRSVVPAQQTTHSRW